MIELIPIKELENLIPSFTRYVREMSVFISFHTRSKYQITNKTSEMNNLSLEVKTEPFKGGQYNHMELLLNQYQCNDYFESIPQTCIRQIEVIPVLQCAIGFV